MPSRRAYLVEVGTVPGAARVGRHRGTGRRSGTYPGRHRARPAVTVPAPRRGTALELATGRQALPAGLATLLVVLTAATVLSGWFAASGAVAVVGMIAR